MGWRLQVYLIIISTSSSCVSSDTVNFYSPTHTVKAADGGDISLEQYLGQVSLVVNVASECGFTDKHYKGLVRLQSLLSETGVFTILAFPCNQFAGQEPNPEADILKFLHEKYQVNFPVFGKINVLETDVPEAWNYLIRESGNAPNWNFWKYLVDHEGNVIGSWGPWSDIEEIFPAVKEAVDAATGGASSRASPSQASSDGVRAPIDDIRVVTDVENEASSIHDDL